MTTRIVAAAAALSVILASAPANAVPTFLSEQNNDDLAYCYVVLTDERFNGQPTGPELFAYTNAAAVIQTRLAERSGNDWAGIESDVTSWARTNVEADATNFGGPRLTPAACSAMADAQ